MKSTTNSKLKIIRVTTVPKSLIAFCSGMLGELSEKYEVIAVSSPGHELEKVAESEGVRTIAVPMERHISMVKDFVSLWRMWRVLRKEKPTMLHSMTPKAGMISMVAGWMAGVPVRVHTFTGLVFPTSTGIKRKILMFTDWLTCACATHVIPEGEGVKNDLLNNGITKKPMKVLGYGNVKGVDMQYYSRREEVIKLSEELKLVDESLFTFLYVGRVVKDKGVNELVAAFKRLADIYSNVRLFIVGPFEEKIDPISESSRSLIENHPCIVASGRKTGDELLAYYASSDCFILPSYREGFPNTVLEAGAMGLPSIVTNINGSREIIVEGKNGMIVPPYNEDALFRAMQTIIQSKIDRCNMTTNARKMIEDRYEQSYVRECLYNYYDEVLKSYV